MGDLFGSVNIANSGIQTVSAQYSVVANNIANVNTAGFVHEQASSDSLVVGGQGLGETMAPIHLDMNSFLQKDYLKSMSQTAQGKELAESLASLGPLLGQTQHDSVAATSLSGHIVALKNAMAALSLHPFSAASQAGVLEAGESLTLMMQQISKHLSHQIQQAQDHMDTHINSLNDGLKKIGQISAQIMKEKASGADSSALEEKRNEMLASFSRLMAVDYSEKPNGDMVVRTESGVQLPTRPDQQGFNDDQFLTGQKMKNWPLGLGAVSGNSQADTELSPYSYYDGRDGNIPAIVLNNPDGKSLRDVTGDLSGGQIGGDLQLRDQIYPKMQAGLDALAGGIIERFKKAGLPLFINSTQHIPDNNNQFNGAYPQPRNGADGNVGDKPATMGGIVGLAGFISLNPKFINNPSDLVGKNGDVGQLGQVIDKAFSEARSDVSGGLAVPSENLGMKGDIDLGYSGNRSLEAVADSWISAASGEIEKSQNNVSFQQTVQGALGKSLQQSSGVNLNDEVAKMLRLKESFAANAKVLVVAQNMMDTFMRAIP